MPKQIAKNILFFIIILLVFFGSAELISRIFIFPGSYDYIERRIIEHNLSQRKKADEFRIFLYGESTMHGGSLYPHSVIGKWLRFYLSDLLPDGTMRRVTIVNFGRMGENSDFIATSFAETAGYKPDVAVFYTVHNDFCIAEYRPINLRKKPFAKKFREFCELLPKKSSFLNLFNREWIRLKIRRNKMTDRRLKTADNWYEAPSAPPEYLNDDNLLMPDSPDFRAITREFRENLDKIMKVARLHSVRAIFFEGLSRWKDYEPVRSMHSPSLSGESLSSWKESFEEAEVLFRRKEYDKALERYHRCLETDDSYALASYRIAECYEWTGKHDKANEYYLLANDNDRFPIRAPSIVNRIYEDIRIKDIKGVDVIQTQKVFEQNSRNGIIDQDLVMDQIHPSIQGQALMALEIVKILYADGLIVPKEKWRWDRLRSFDEMAKKLNLSNDNLFSIYLLTGNYLVKHHQEASKFLEKALEINPKSLYVKSWLAWTYWNIGNTGEALKLYRELYKERPSLAARFFKRHPEIERGVTGREAVQ